MTVHELTVAMTPFRGASFREPLNVVLRGLLGGAFRVRRCLTGETSCAGCGDAPLCDFDRVFERDLGLVQRAFWLRGLHAGRELNPRARLRVTVALLDRERAMIPDFSAALRTALRSLGCEHEGYNEVGIVHRTSAPLAPPPLDPARTAAVRVTPRTPLMLRGREDSGAELCPGAPEVGTLLRAGVRRLAAIAQASDPEGGVPRVAWPDLRSLRLVECRIEEWDDARRSKTQRRTQPLEGVQGTYVIEGPGLIEVIPLLRAMERVGVGRKTSFGFGKIAVEALA